MKIIIFSSKEEKKISRTSFSLYQTIITLLLHHFHFTYRKTPDLANRVSTITEGTCQADMIQDLNDLAVLGTELCQ